MKAILLGHARQMVFRKILCVWLQTVEGIFLPWLCFCITPCWGMEKVFAYERRKELGLAPAFTREMADQEPMWNRENKQICLCQINIY